MPDTDTSCNSTLDSIHISKQDVIDIISNLKQNKACGTDMINHRLLKESVHVISEPLSEFFNKSLNSGKFPDSWKMANVSPIFKSKQRNIVSNYRPISLLSSLSKVFERCVFKSLFNYLRDNYLISVHQSAYIPGDSTVNQLVSMYHNTCLALDQTIDIQLIFFDISKAFDKV